MYGYRTISHATYIKSYITNNKKKNLAQPKSDFSIKAQYYTILYNNNNKELQMLKVIIIYEWKKTYDNHST